MILNGENPVVSWLHQTCSTEDSEGQENEHRLTLLMTRPNCQVFIPVPNNSEAAAPAATCDLSSPLGPTRDLPQPAAAADTRRTSSESNVLGFTRSGQFGRGAAVAEAASEQVENDDPFSASIRVPTFQQRGGGVVGSGRRVSSDPEVCELFRESDVRVTTTTTMRCGGDRAKVAGFQRWQKVEGQRSGSGASVLTKTFGSDDLGGGRRRGQLLRDLNVIQRPSLDFDKMQRYCLARVHPSRGAVSKPRIVKVKCLPGSTSSYSSHGRVVRSEFLDPSIFSFRSISQNPNSRRSITVTPSLSDEN